MEQKYIDSWEDKKEEILEVLDQTEELGKIDTDIAELMRELIHTAKLRSSIELYYNEQKEDSDET